MPGGAIQLATGAPRKIAGRAPCARAADGASNAHAATKCGTALVTRLMGSMAQRCEAAAPRANIRAATCVGPSAARLCSRLPRRLLRENGREVHERFGRLFQPSPRVELQLAVELVAPGVDVRAGQ